MRDDCGPCCDFTRWTFNIMGGRLRVVKTFGIEYVRAEMWDAQFCLGDLVIEVFGHELSEMMNNLRDDLAEALAGRYAGVADG